MNGAKICPYPVDTSHILIVLSRDAETMKSPDGMKVTLETLWSCPEKKQKEWGYNRFNMVVTFNANILESLLFHTSYCH